MDQSKDSIQEQQGHLRLPVDWKLGEESELQNIGNWNNSLLCILNALPDKRPHLEILRQSFIRQF